jgi:excisionase family DNA binding protein
MLSRGGDWLCLLHRCVTGAGGGKVIHNAALRVPLAHNRGMDENGTVDVGALGRFLTLADTAEILNISASQAYALVRSGELPAIKIGPGGHWRVERSVLESYIEAMYEVSRRASLWNQSDYANVTEFSRG